MILGCVALATACERPEPVRLEESAAAAVEPSEVDWFVEATEESGLDFRHRSGAVGTLRMPEVMGGGHLSGILHLNTCTIVQMST